MNSTTGISPNLIGEERVASGVGELVRHNPADTREVVSVFPLVAAERVREAVASATSAQQSWAALGGPARGDILYTAAEILREQRDTFAQLITREEGKPLADSAAEVARAVATLRFYGSCGRLIAGQTLPSSDPRTQIYTERFPIGVVALITPWNFPLAIPCQKIAPALVSGNAVVLKPSSLTPAVALRLVDVLLQAGIPPGVLNLVTCSGAVAGDVFSGDSRIGAISFTGSSAAGGELHRASQQVARRIQLEMGGKNVAVVLADADLDLTVDCLIRGCFALTGQSCTATGLVLVDRAVYESVVERLTAESQRLRVGPGLDPLTDIGPAASEEEVESTLGAIRTAVDEGATVMAGGGQTDREPLRHGHFSQPTVLAGVAPWMRAAQEEIFGPVAMLAPVEDLGRAIATVNELSYGLTAAVFTQSLASAREFVRRIDVGIVKVNAPTTGLELHVPFGGFKGSSNDAVKELGTTALDFFTHEKSVYASEGRL